MWCLHSRCRPCARDRCAGGTERNGDQMVGLANESVTASDLEWFCSASGGSFSARSVTKTQTPRCPRLFFIVLDMEWNVVDRTLLASSTRVPNAALKAKPYVVLSPDTNYPPPVFTLRCYSKTSRGRCESQELNCRVGARGVWRAELGLWSENSLRFVMCPETQRRIQGVKSSWS